MACVLGPLGRTNKSSKGCSSVHPASFNGQDIIEENRPPGINRSKVMELLGAVSPQERRQINDLLNRTYSWNEAFIVSTFTEDCVLPQQSKEDDGDNDKAIGLLRPHCVDMSLKNDVHEPQYNLLAGQGLMDQANNIAQKLAITSRRRKMFRLLGLAEKFRVRESTGWSAKSPWLCASPCHFEKGGSCSGAKPVGIFPSPTSRCFEKHYLPSPQDCTLKEVKPTAHPLPQPPLSRSPSLHEQTPSCISDVGKVVPRQPPTSSQYLVVSPNVFCKGAPQIQPLVEQGESSSLQGPALNVLSPPPTPKPVCPRKWTKGVVIGQGTFGVVHEGLNLEDGSFFAVKISNTEDMSLEIQQEIEVLSKLKHPNIVRYFGSSIEDDRLCIFLELVRMGSLEAILRKYKQFEDNTIRSYTRQMLRGLEYLHANKTIHRDIKCANILVDVDGQVKLSDFGVAKQMDESLASSLKGTTLYMAPEVLTPNKQCYSFSADIWSLGCTVLEMADGRPPWSNLEGFGFLFKVKKGELPPMPEHLSPEGRDFVCSCLKFNAKDRPTATELLQHPFVKHVSPSEQFLPQATTSITPTDTSLYPSLKSWQCEDEHDSSVSIQCTLQCTLSQR